MWTENVYKSVLVLEWYFHCPYKHLYPQKIPTQGLETGIFGPKNGRNGPFREIESLQGRNMA